jgi:hypothetical protein
MAKIGAVLVAVAALVISVPLGRAQVKKDTTRSEPGFQELADWVTAASDTKTVLPARFAQAAGLHSEAEIFVRGKAYQSSTDASRHNAFMVASIDGRTELLMYYQPDSAHASIWRVANSDDVLGMGIINPGMPARPIPKGQFPAKC